MSVDRNLERPFLAGVLAGRKPLIKCSTFSLGQRGGNWYVAYKISIEPYKISI